MSTAKGEIMKESGSIIDMNYLEKILTEKDNLYRDTKGMTSLRNLSFREHMDATVKERYKVDKRITDGKKCEKCGKFSVISLQIQTRASDEGTNTLHRCTDMSCKHTRISA
jgi:DNA-directed RNA polymerase subunit M/transcription elongation factor TFIIS